MGVKDMRQVLQEAAIRFTALRDLLSALVLDQAAEAFGDAKKRARVRRERWKERRAVQVGDGVKTCRVGGCRLAAEWRPVLSFPPADGGEDRIRVETAMLDVCDSHARSLGPEAYTHNPDVWGAITKVWVDAGIQPPDPTDAQVDYIRNDNLVDPG